MTDADEAPWISAKREIIERVSREGDFVRAVLSGRRRNHQPAFDRLDIRPVLIKDGYQLQVISLKDNQATTKNYAPKDLVLSDLMESGFSNFLVETRSERHEVRVGKKGQIFSKSTRVDLAPSYEHDRQKPRILAESDPYLIAVGISDSSGRVKPSMRDKYLQVEEFLRILAASIDPQQSKKRTLRIIDLGCGHAYLTFAAIRFFQTKGINATFEGVDVRADSRERNTRLAEQLGISDLVRFIDSEISTYAVHDVDVAIALHACDTATDDALAWAIKANAELILAAPCCHHDLHAQVKDAPKTHAELFKHGILKVRQMDILTDALRASLLEISGYKAEVFEFISGDHTARNLMIRGIRSDNRSKAAEKLAEQIREYRHTCALWGIKPALEERLELGSLQAND